MWTMFPLESVAVTFTVATTWSSGNRERGPAHTGPTKPSTKIRNETGAWVQDGAMTLSDLQKREELVQLNQNQVSD